VSSFARESLTPESDRFRNKVWQKGYGVKWEIIGFSVLFEVKEGCPHEPVRFELQIIRFQTFALWINTGLNLKWADISLKFKKKIKLGLSTSTSLAVKLLMKMGDKLLGNIILYKGSFILIEEPLSLRQQLNR
jgi:hypothetical protein